MAAACEGNPVGALFGGGDYKGRSVERAAVHQPDGVFEGISVVGCWQLNKIGGHKKLCRCGKGKREKGTVVTRE